MATNVASNEEISNRVEQLKRYIFNTLLGPLSDEITYTLRKPITRCHYSLDLPIDFRKVESQIGFISLAIRDYVVFQGIEPFFVPINKMGNPEISDAKKYLYIGDDVDARCYAYCLQNRKAVRIVSWFSVDDTGFLKESDLQNYDGTFLDLLEDKIFSYLS